MAANPLVFNNYLQNTLQVDQVAVHTAINDQGLSMYQDFIGLTDQNVKDLCDNCKKLGGLIPNPMTR